MLYLIGLGLGDAADITVKGLQALRRCSRVYLEAYTSVLTVGKEALVSPNRAIRTNSRGGNRIKRNSVQRNVWVTMVTRSVSVAPWQHA